MNDNVNKTRPITIAVSAIGGQGGGVLADWIVSLAEHNGYFAQATSVPGVAQRTGATIYYLELFPEDARRKAGRDPVLSLMPMPGDVDVVLAAEFTEIGRAVQRGFVTPDRTTLIGSSHRVYGISEKTAMGDGTVDPEPILRSGEEAARRFIHFDMDALAQAQGSVISATLFGALAGSEALPFPREAYEDAIRRGGIGVDASLRAFAAAYERTVNGEPPEEAPGAEAQAPGKPANPVVAALLERVDERLPEPVRFNAREGVRRMLDYQDPAYARLYLDRLEAVVSLEEANGGDTRAFRTSAETARHLALWMSYEDTIRVADLKTRGRRFERVSEEVRAQPDQIVYMTEYMHPRVEEICDTMPAGLGRWVMGSPRLRGLLTPFTRRGRHIRTAKLSGFTLLYFLAGLRRWRRRTLRYQVEQERIEDWLKRIRELLPRNPGLAHEVVRAQRLVKGYGDTHARGWRNFQILMDVVDRHAERSDAPQQLQRMCDAALADEEGKSLQGMVQDLDAQGATAKS